MDYFTFDYTFCIYSLEIHQSWKNFQQKSIKNRINFTRRQQSTIWCFFSSGIRWICLSLLCTWKRKQIPQVITYRCQNRANAETHLNVATILLRLVDNLQHGFVQRWRVSVLLSRWRENATPESQLHVVYVAVSDLWMKRKEMVRQHMICERRLSGVVTQTLVYCLLSCWLYA